MFDKIVHRFARFNHEHDLARPLQSAGKFLQRMRSDNFLPAAAAAGKCIDLLNRAIVHCNCKSMTLHIKYEVFTHHRKTDQTDISFLFHRFSFFLIHIYH